MKTFNKQHLPSFSMLIIPLLSIIIVSSATAAPQDPKTFLTFLERHVTEDSASANAYYAAIDPDNKKTTYADWLVEAGFIPNTGVYNSTGIYPENAFASVTYQNVADLGFIRRVRARCEPSCDVANPDIYALIENYPRFEDEALRQNRLASVTMEWKAAADGSKPSKKFVTFYAFNGADSREQAPGIPFHPDLDGDGNKAVPGLCSSCHGGEPKELNADGSYPDNGNTESLFIPSDLVNYAYNDSVPGFSRIDQEAEFKKMNLVALVTHRGKKKYDEEAGFSRLPAAHELIEGWYGGPGMPNPTFDEDFTPVGWLGAQELYHKSIAPACRACHAQQKRELDFATYVGFMEFEDAHKELVLRIECGLDDDSKDRENGADDQAVMPLAKETFNRFWDLDGGEQVNVFKDHLGEVDCEDYN